MASTTVVSDDSVTTVISEPEVAVEPGFWHRISWSAIFSGALVATAVTFFLLALGSGFGLSLVSARNATADTAVTFLTLGAIYFFVAQAFGFAAGAHLAGRLMGPVLENPKEEEFLAGAHGLVTWALAVVATATIIYLSALATGTAAIGGAVLGASSGNSQTTPAATGYWVDRLFRASPQAIHASIGWHDYAQLDGGTATDAAPVPDETGPAPAQGAMMGTTPAPAPVVTSATPMAPRGAMMSSETIGAATTGPADIQLSGPAAHSLAGDKAEAGRILDVGMANGGTLSDVDRAQLAMLVAEDTGQTEDSAMRRVENVEKQMHEAELKAAEAARKTAAYASLWTALALLFGGVVATMAAISARWEDDRITFGFGARE